MTRSNVVFRVDATDASDQRLDVEIEVEAPFTASSLKLSFPRWVPGSYFLREPIQHVSHLQATDGNGNPLNVVRKDVDSIVVKVFHRSLRYAFVTNCSVLKTRFDRIILMTHTCT